MNKNKDKLHANCNGHEFGKWFNRGIINKFNNDKTIWLLNVSLQVINITLSFSFFEIFTKHLKKMHFGEFLVD